MKDFLYHKNCMMLMKLNNDKDLSEGVTYIASDFNAGGYRD